jgi:dUTPase
LEIIFEHPFDLSLIDELNPSFLIQSSASLELPEGNIPNIAERSTLAISFGIKYSSNSPHTVRIKIW